MNDNELIIALVSTVAFFSVPVVAILVSHQRKMAEIIHGKRDQQMVSNNEAIASEMQQLRQAIHQQTIALDSLTTQIRKGLPSANEPLSSRLAEEQIRLGPPPAP
jgi:hypothetical protein